MCKKFVWNWMEELRLIITRFLRTKVNDPELVNDLVQDTLLKVLATKNQDIVNVKAWAIRVAKNLLIDHYRRVYKYFPGNELPDYEYDHLTDEILACQKMFIDELDEESRFLINEIDLKRRSQKEVAEQMGIPYPSLRSKVQRARKKIKDRFEELCVFEYDAAGSITCCWEKACVVK